MKGMKKLMKKNIWMVYVIGASICIAITSHLFVINEWFDGTYFIGIRDGMSQMLPFKQLLYDNYTNGEFFYADHLGMGGGTYAQLGYYYSTSIVFIGTVIVTYVLESLGFISHPDLMYWADAVLIVSMIRMVIILFVTTIFIKALGFRTRFAFIGAALYATCTMYFRHVIYWEFFADAMIWLPLLLLGIERIIRGRSSLLFVVMVAVSMVDNFYFAYVNFIIAIIYIVFRNIVRFDEDVRTFPKQVYRYLLGGVIGFGLSAFAFIPTVYGYLQNDRPLFTESFPMFEMEDNPFLNGRTIVIPAIMVACVWLYDFYRSKVFRLFALLTGVMLVMHFSPYVASMFNGFSAPQYRWEYALILMGGVVVTYAVTHIRSISKGSLVSAIAGLIITYSYFYWVDEDLTMQSEEMYYLVRASLAILVVFVLLLWKRTVTTQVVLMLTIVGASLWIANTFQAEKLSFVGTDEEVSKDWVASDAYDGDDQQELIDLLNVREKDPFMRIDWMIPERNNTPLVQDFRGFSAYSSILNAHLLHFYWHDLMIDMKRESVSRYATLGDRTNLYSLLYGKYVIKDVNDETIPFGFEEVATIGSYVAYENTHALPFARTTSDVYAEEDLADAHPIEKERAMIDGVILDEDRQTKSIANLEAEEITDYDVQTNGSTYEDGLLNVTEERGGLDLTVNAPDTYTGDYYVSFYIKRQNKDALYNLTVNDYKTSRKKNTSIYRTGIDNVVIRIPAEETISIQVPAGEYVLEDIQVHAEKYDTLIEAVEQEEKKDQPAVTMDKSDIYINHDNVEKDTHLVLPVPYEKGWTAEVNGKKEQVLQANYSFIAVPMDEGENEITLTYVPPYFYSTSMLSLGTLLSLMFVHAIRRRKYAIK